MKITDYPKSIRRRLLCRLGWHDPLIVNEMKNGKIRLNCRHCRYSKMVDFKAVPGEIEKLTTHVHLNKDGNGVEQMILQGGVPLMTVDYTRGEAIYTGQVMMNQARKLARVVHSNHGQGPMRKPHAT